MELAGELDGLYEGALVGPCDAGPLTVQLSADLRNARIALDPLSLEITGTANSGERWLDARDATESIYPSSREVASFGSYLRLYG